MMMERKKRRRRYLMATKKEKYCISHDLLGGVLSDLGVRSIEELMEKTMEEVPNGN